MPLCLSYFAASLDMLSVRSVTSLGILPVCRSFLLRLEYRVSIMDIESADMVLVGS